MKIIVVGGTGTIGREVVKLLSSSHEIVTVGYDDGDLQVDIASKDAIEGLFREVGSLDASRPQITKWEPTDIGARGSRSRIAPGSTFAPMYMAGEISRVLTASDTVEPRKSIQRPRRDSSWSKPSSILFALVRAKSGVCSRLGSAEAMVSRPSEKSRKRSAT